MLGEKYVNHEIFTELKKFTEFYSSISDMLSGSITHGTATSFNIDMYVFKSMEGTLDSIRDVLLKGRINDSYLLLRKYYDSAIINIYSNLFLEDNFSVEKFVVQEIAGWVKGEETIPSFEVMSKYIINSWRVKEITNILYNKAEFKGSIYDKIRQRCNEHTHFSNYFTLLLNDGDLHLEERFTALECLAVDIRNLFLLHISYLLYFREDYMRSSDYIDYLDAGLMPEEGSQQWVAQFIQEIFDEFIKPQRPEIASTIKAKTRMDLH